MSNQKFTHCNDLDGNSQNTDFKVLQSSFGDGYTQRTSVGINNKSSTWAYKKTGKKALIQEIKAFFDDHKGSDSFLWDSPLDGEVRVAGTLNLSRHDSTLIAGTFQLQLKAEGGNINVSQRYIHAMTMRK